MAIVQGRAVRAAARAIRREGHLGSRGHLGGNPGGNLEPFGNRRPLDRAEPQQGPQQGSQPGRAGLSLLFASGERPSIRAVEQLIASATRAGPPAEVTHRPDPAAGWIEVLTSGLTFDLAGMAPARALAPPPMEHQFGLSQDAAKFDFEAVTIMPGAHIAGGSAMLPVVRAQLGLAEALAAPLAARAVCWHPTGSWMEAGYFGRIVMNWLSGGAFPALGLTAVQAQPDGTVESCGLGFFAGQEVRVEPVANEPRSETVKLAVRIIDYIARHGALTAMLELQDEHGHPILAEPSFDGRDVRVWRGT